VRLIVGDLFCEVDGNIDEYRELGKVLKVRNPKANYQSKYSQEEVPEYIEFLDENGMFLRGLLPWVEDKLQLLELDYEIEYEKEEIFNFFECPVDIVNPPLRDYQKTAVEHGFYYKRGILHLATGAGKGNIIVALARMNDLHEGGRTLTFVNKTSLMYQQAERFRQLGVSDVGVIGAGDFAPNTHTVCMVQTASKLLRRGNTDWMEGVTLTMWDETHHLGADTWVALAKNIAAKRSIGLSGTPFRQGISNYADPSDIQLLGITGGVVVSVPASYLIRQGVLAKPYIYMIPILQTDQPLDDLKGKQYGSVEKVFITNNGYRNNVFARLTLQLAERELNPLLLVSKVEHGKTMLRELSKLGLTGYFLSGGPTRHFYDRLADVVVSEKDDNPDTSMRKFLTGEHQFLIGSTIFDEGIDLPAVTDVLNLAGGRSFIKTMQRAGRGLRAKTTGENVARIWDAYDYSNEWLTRHSSERVSDYSSESEYVVYESGYAESVKLFGHEW
jgi:superfamily II DNA or RNA helicase